MCLIHQWIAKIIYTTVLSDCLSDQYLHPHICAITGAAAAAYTLANHPAGQSTVHRSGTVDCSVFQSIMCGNRHHMMASQLQ